MLNRLSKWIGSNLVDQSDSERQEIVVYGIEMAIYTLISTMGLLLIGFLLQMALPTAILILVYYANQAVGGGYHASTHLTCFISMAVALVICIEIIRFHLFSEIVYCLIVAASGVYLWCHPLHLHPNKQYLLPQRESICKKSHLVLFCSILLTVVLYPIDDLCFHASSLAIASAAISRSVSIIQERDKRISSSS